MRSEETGMKSVSQDVAASVTNTAILGGDNTTESTYDDVQSYRCVPRVYLQAYLPHTVGLSGVLCSRKEEENAPI